MPSHATQTSSPSAPNNLTPPELIKIPSSRTLCQALDAYNIDQQRANEARPVHDRKPMWRQIALFGQAPLMPLAGRWVTAENLGAAVRHGLLRVRAYTPQQSYPHTVACELVDAIVPQMDEASRMQAHAAAKLGW